MKKIYEAPTSELLYVATCDIITGSLDDEDVAEDDLGTGTPSVG